MALRPTIWTIVIILLLSVASVESYKGVSKRLLGNRVVYYCEVSFLGSSTTSSQRREKVWVGTYDTEFLAGIACDVAFYYTNRLSDINCHINLEEAIFTCCEPKSSYESLNNWDERREFIRAQANALVTAIQSPDFQYSLDSIVAIQSELIAEQVVAYFSTRPKGPLQELMAFMAWFLDPSNEQQILQVHDQISAQQQRDAVVKLYTDHGVVLPEVDPIVNLDNVATHMQFLIQARSRSSSSIMYLLLLFGTALPSILGGGLASSTEDEREKIWTKLQVLRKVYLEDMIELFALLTAQSNQPMPAEQLQKVNYYRDILNRMIPYMRVPKDRLPKEFNMENMEWYEKQLVNIMEFKRRHQGDL